MKKIVISGINLKSGGPLSVIKDALEVLSHYFTDKFEIIALVHDKKMYKDIEGIEYIEIKDSRSSWLKRIYYEYIYFYFFSKKIKPYLWLSMHDITPNVIAEKRAVYCHNPSPFYKISAFEKQMDKKFSLFNLFYKYLYRINIQKNNFVIVQQSWLREEFKKRYKVKNIIVAYPNIEVGSNENNESITFDRLDKKLFFYPAFPRVFKNFELICETAKHFKNRKDIEFVITISGNENEYAKYLLKKYGDIPNLKFVGLLSREKVFEYYKRIDSLIFSSKLETWGLPITEFKEYKKPIFLANLPYAKETVGNYEKVSFFDPNDPKELISNLDLYLNNRLEFQKSNLKDIEEPFTRSWKELFSLLLKE